MQYAASSKHAIEYEQAEKLEVPIRDEFESNLEKSSLLGDLITASLGRVSWQEIIENNHLTLPSRV